MSAPRHIAGADTARFRRDPDTVMRLARMGAAHPTRLSFLRVLLRRMRAERWRVDRPLFEVDAQGVGRAVYRVTGPVRSYSLVSFAHDLPDAMRSDRVIATAWDATFALYDGTPDAAALDRLAANVPLQEAGRLRPTELTMSRANRSVRLFEHVTTCLAAGRQPDPATLARTGYLMRTTAVYGSGKFGAAARRRIADRPELAAPFQVEMLTVWLIRIFAADMAEHMARMRGGDRAAALAPALRRALGVGNSTGLGMAPFLVRHPGLLNNWMVAREDALARVRALPAATPDTLSGFAMALAAARENAHHWHSDHPLQQDRLAALRGGLAQLDGHVTGGGWDRDARHPWDGLWCWAEGALPLEAQEALLALMLEPHGALVDGLADGMADPEDGADTLDGAMPAGRLRALIAQQYGWALAPDYAAPEGCAHFWYVSRDKLEPRLGARAHDPGAEAELPLDIGRRVAALDRALAGWPGATPLARVLLDAPEHRLAARRVQATAGRPFAEIRDNLIGDGLLPIDMLRCKLAFFGATRFDPRSDRCGRRAVMHVQPGADAVALSLPEIGALTARALRGAGRDWGEAEDAGAAMQWLARAGLDWATPLVSLLGTAPGARPTPAPGAWTAPDLACPLRTGLLLADFATLPEGPGHGTLALPMMAQPLLLLPFVARAAAALDRPLLAADGAFAASLAPGRPPVIPPVAVTHAAPRITHDTASPADGPGWPEHPPRGVLRPALYDALCAHALNMTVPSTARSMAGAGADVTDND